MIPENTISKKKQMKHNRKFNCLQRNTHYEQAYLFYYQLQQQTSGSFEGLVDAKKLELVTNFSKSINEALQYARESVFPAKRYRLPQYRDDRVYGILREELIFVNFLEEMVSSIQYMLSRLETDNRLKEFRNELEHYRREHEMRGNNNQAGFVTMVLKSLDELQTSDRDHVDHILKSINQRFEVGNRLFSLIREMQNFE
jgi:hypothetical protein